MAVVRTPPRVEALAGRVLPIPQVDPQLASIAASQPDRSGRSAPSLGLSAPAPPVPPLRNYAPLSRFSRRASSTSFGTSSSVKPLARARCSADLMIFCHFRSLRYDCTASVSTSLTLRCSSVAAFCTCHQVLWHSNSCVGHLDTFIFTCFSAAYWQTITGVYKAGQVQPRDPRKVSN
jgi:hypothetical protein